MILLTTYHLIQNQKMKTNKIIYFRKPVQDDKSYNIEEQQDQIMEQHEEILAQRKQIFDLINGEDNDRQRNLEDNIKGLLS